MKRGGPLRRTPLARGASELKRTRLAPVSQKGRAKIEAAAALVRREGKAFHDAIVGEACVACGRTAWEARAAGTRHQAHHAISQQRLRRLGLERLAWAPELALCLCEEPCHRRHTDAVARLRRGMIPESRRALLEAWCASHGLLDALSRELPE